MKLSSDNYYNSFIEENKKPIILSSYNALNKYLNQNIKSTAEKTDYDDYDGEYLIDEDDKDYLDGEE